MLSTLAVCVSVVALTIGLSGDVTGKWEMSVDSPHGHVSMTLGLKQAGGKVTGHIATPHGERPLKGEFADATLTMFTTDDQPEMSFTAKLTESGALTGHLSGPMGDMKWTAARVKGH
jgi:hypothetical protein